MRSKSAKTPLKTREDSSRNVKTMRIAISSVALADVFK
jgi:hypothetical protein